MCRRTPRIGLAEAIEAEVSKEADGRIGWSIVGAGGKFEKCIRRP
jgi:hypothetical protein